MSNRSLLYLTISLGAIALALTAFDQWKARRNAEWGLPEDRQLVTTEILRQVNTIQVKQADSVAVELTRNQDKQWIVSNHHKMPASSDRLNSLVNALTENDIVRFVTRNPEKAERLGVGQKSLQLLNGEGERIHALHFGKNAKNGGIFLRRNQEEDVYLSAFDDRLPTDVSQWIEKQLIDAKMADIQQVFARIPGSDEDLMIKREKTEDSFQLESELPEASLAASTFESNLRSLLNARLVGIHTIDELSDYKESMADPVELQIQFFDGEQISLKFGRTTRTVEKENEEGEITEETEHGPLYLSVSGSLAYLNIPSDVDSPLVFEMSDYLFNSLPSEDNAWLNFEQKRETTDESAQEGPEPIESDS